MNVRYSVFLSSTFEDLREIRKELSYELFMNGYMVNNMESFGARNGSVWEVIKESIADSDMLVMVIAGRYGSINPDEGHKLYGAGIQLCRRKKNACTCLYTGQKCNFNSRL